MIQSSPGCCLIVLALMLNLQLLPKLAASSFTNETDYQALLAIKSQITSDPSDALRSWNDSTPFCAWPGVTCGKKHRRVTILSLPALYLVGSLSPHIGNLSFLRGLNLNQNGFKGIIPSEITRLSRLEIITVQNNSFKGELPMNLTHCRNLMILALEGNCLCGRIPDELGSMPKLTKIGLSVNHFIGELPPSLGNLSTLTHLYISENHIQGRIPPEFARLSNLIAIQLGMNNITGFIPRTIYNISSVVMFAVTSNNLKGDLPSDFFLRLPNLQELYLGNNSFSGPIPSSIVNASKLERIDLFLNSFSGSIPANLGSLHKLQLLNFAGNHLGSEEGDDLSFLTSLTNSTKLSVLWMTRNILKGVVPNSIANLSTTLTSFRLEENFISGAIPEGIGNLVNLELLTLYTNEFSGRIPDSFGKLSKLRLCYVHQNNISGRIPSSLGNLTFLIRLSLSDNRLERTVPASIANCTSLIGLDLSKNYLVGVVPKEIFSLSALSLELLLDRNNLTGPLPLEVGKLENLGKLVLSENNMSGDIPTTLGDCLVLESLYLDGNHFSGVIPDSLKNLRGIRFLDLSRNNLSGPIPSFLVDLPLVEYLNLSFNMLKGEVPKDGIFSNLSIISLEGNHNLCGGPSVLRLPQCKGRNRKRSTTLLPVTISVSISVVVLSICFIVLVFHRSKLLRKQRDSSSPTENQYPQLSYGELFRATGGFSGANIIGEGSFGTVYKGVLQGNNNQVIAVKILKLEEGGATKSFMAECETLRNIRHRNLIRIITACSSIDFSGNDFKALVFEFMPNGNLEKWLHPSSSEIGGISAGRLSLLQRLNIAIDVATALIYLHHNCQVPIVHCDLKSSNVLLDSDLSARVTDFGLAKFLMVRASQSHSQSSSIGIRGTLGYIAPEYGIGGEVSTQGDVYSFGILLLEMFTGNRPTGAMFEGRFGLREFIVRASPDGLMQVVDPILLSLVEEPNPNGYGQRDDEATVQKCLAMIFQVGVICSATLPNERLDIREAAVELNKARDLLLSGRRGRRRYR